MLFSSILDFVHAKIIVNNRGNIKAKLALISSIIINLSLLFYFKYSGFFLETINKLFDSNLNVIAITLPIGISFYTFQTMSYTIDVYRNEAKPQKSLISFATYVSLFPQLVAGPIVRYQTVADELNDRTHSVDKFYDGIILFVLGLGKKVILANNIGLIWNYVKLENIDSLSIFTAWLGIMSFGLQIYFDFSGYSDMAIGLGKMFGFNFSKNFDYPYISKSITEFWRRWHISLGTWFRDYLYIPLGGNRKGKLKWIRNIFIVWFVTGLWHGAGFNFIFWGVFFGIILFIEKIFLLKKMEKTPNFLKYLYVILIVSISWVFFELEGVNDIILYIKAMFINNNIIDETFVYLFIPNIILIALSILIATPIMNKFLLKNKYIEAILIIMILFLSVAFLVDASFNPFLYFRF
jgi:alginate O-acetyltransferase complex protein AlgI